MLSRFRTLLNFSSNNKFYFIIFLIIYKLKILILYTLNQKIEIACAPAEN
jgi:hypothetical protein